MAIPKRPLAVSKAKKTLPLTIDWGEGIPKDRLRYINAREEGLIKASRSTTAERSHAGVTAYADDSASSKGVERGPSPSRGADGPSGVGRGASGAGGPSRAGQGPNSSPSRSSSSPSSAGGGSKSSSSSTPASSPSKAPNAAAQAASDKYNATSPSTNASAASVSRAAASVSTSKAPNAAAAAASDRLRAMDKATAASKASSVQSMINNQGQTAPNGSYYGPKGAAALNSDARMAAARSVGFNPTPVKRTPGDAEYLGRMMQAESYAIKNRFGNASVPGLMGVGEVARNRMLSDSFKPDTVQGVLDQYKQFSPMRDGSFARTPANDMNTRIAESILSGESPPTVGNALNYGNLDTINNKPNYSSEATKAAFNSMNVTNTIADARNPKTFSHSFGTLGNNSDVAFNGSGSLGTVGLSAATSPTNSVQQRMDALDPRTPGPSSIPSPNGSPMMPGMTAPPQRLAASIQAPTQPPSGWGQPPAPNDPRVSTAPGSYPASKPSALPGFTPQSGFTPQGLPGNFRGTAGQAYNTTSPSTYSPQAGPGDQVAGDAPQISSDNPMQGPSNPMQEGENPQIKRDRQLKYASRGSTIGGIIAGPIGTVVGATLGWQMGKTPPRQRQAIASNPQALRANVQSINTMVEERGGKGNPQMQVTDAGLRDVLTDPSKVQSNPAQYTTLEQMLAALAQGIDPSTGKPV